MARLYVGRCSLKVPSPALIWMKQLSWFILALAILSVLSFNLERVRPASAIGFIDFGIWLCGLELVAIFVMLSLPALRRLSPIILLTFGIGVYFLGGGLVFKDPQYLFTAGGIAISAAEIVILSMMILLARNIGNQLDDIDRVIVNEALGGTARPLQKLEQASESIQSELLRSHRYCRPLSIIVVEPDSESIRATLPHAVEQAVKALANRYVLMRLGHAIRSVVRHTDTVLVQGAGTRYIILCPETDCANTRALIERIQLTTAKDFGISVACGDAYLPDYQVTFEELIHQAEREFTFPAGHLRQRAVEDKNKNP